MKDYVAVITTFNRKEKLKIAIKKLEAQSLLPKKIVVIDNHSTDGTNLLMEDYYDNNLIYYKRLPENIGGAGGFYEGVKEAQKFNPDYIALSDDDAWYENNYFKNIKQASENDNYSKAFIGIAKDPQTGEKTPQGIKLSDWITLDKFSKTKGKYCNIITFCGFVFATELISKVGLPSKDFFIWLDDREYGLKISQQTKITLVRDAFVIHPHDKRGKDGLIPIWKNYYGNRNGIVLLREFSKNIPKANVKNFIYLIKHCIAVLIKAQYKGQRMKYLYSYICAYIDGYRNKLGRNNKFMP